MSSNINEDYSLKTYETNKLERRTTSGVDHTDESVIPFRLMINGATALRGQTTSGKYESFIGDQKS
jgi:hypothetical protein